jgi:hypothetical protein
MFHTKISVSLQTPTYPYIAGPLALPDPPIRLYHDNQLPSQDAVPSLSHRPLFLPSRALTPALPLPIPSLSHLL